MALPRAVSRAPRKGSDVSGLCHFADRLALWIVQTAASPRGCFANQRKAGAAGATIGSVLLVSVPETHVRFVMRLLGIVPGLFRGLRTAI